MFTSTPVPGSGRKRPIALEIHPKTPDDREVLGTEEIHPDANTTPESADQPTSEAEQVRPEDDASETSKEALDAMDQVDQNAQSLIEDAIDDLLVTGATQDPVSDYNSAQTELENAANESMSSEDIDAMLDTLDSTTDEAESEAESEAGSQAESHDETDTSSSGLDDIENMTDDELLTGIAQELLNDESNPLGEDIDQPIVIDAEDDQPEAEAEQDTEPVSETVEAIDDTADLLDEIAEGIVEQSPASDEPVEEVPDDTAAEAVEPMTESVEASETEETAEPEPEPESDASLESIDDMLADIGDDLISGDFETPEGELVGSDEAGIQDASSLLDQLNLDDLGLGDSTQQEATQELAAEELQSESAEPAPTEAPAAVSSEAAPVATATESYESEPQAQAQPTASEPTPSPSPSAAQSSAAQVKVEQIDEVDPPIPEVESIWQTAQRHATRAGLFALEQAKTHVAPIAAKGVLLINKPVQEKAPQMRDTIGFLALWTALLATILWFYIAFVRETPTPTPSTAPTRMLEQGEIVDPLRNPPPQP